MPMMNIQFGEVLTTLGARPSVSTVGNVLMGSPAYVDVKEYHRILIGGWAQGLTGGTTFTIELWAATSAAGANAAQVGTQSWTVALGFTQDFFESFEVFEDALPAGSHFAAVFVWHDNVADGPFDLGCAIIGGEPVVKPAPDATWNTPVTEAPTATPTPTPTPTPVQ